MYNRYPSDVISAYASTFLDMDYWYVWDNKQDGNKNPFQSCIDLWNLGLVPEQDYDSKWRLHSGENMDIVYKKMYLGE